MKIAFVGADEGSHVALSTICASGHVPELVVTLPPQLAHRHSDFFDLSLVADRYDIPLHYTANTNSAGTIRVFKKLNPDLVLVIGWSQICSAELLAIPKIGCIGFHPSALPRFRGHCAIPWTILSRARDAGTSLFWLSEGVCDGPIAAQARYAINPDTVTSRELYDRALRALTGLLPQLLTQIQVGDIPAEPQPSIGVSICPSPRAEFGLVDWKYSASEIHLLIRALGSPNSGAFTYSQERSIIFLRSAQVTQGEFYVDFPPGKVLSVSGETFTVGCGDGLCLEVTEWSGTGATPPLYSQLGNTT